MRDTIANLPGSRIREVANAGIGRPDVLAFWFGESDEVTPLEVREAAARSLSRGETFYTHNLGQPALREAIAAYQSSLHNKPIAAERIAVTSSGVSGLMLAMQMLAGAGSTVVCVTPVWPNLTAQPEILGARVLRMPLAPDAQGAWRLDLAALLEAITPDVAALLVNAPNNPTGWTLTRPEQQALLDRCRATGTWIVADEVYERVWFGEGRAAPSFLDIAEPHDQLIVAHSFSKSFLMTGWRIGWLVLPPGTSDAIGKLIEFNTSCAPAFVQQGALAALALGEGFIVPLVQRLRECRDRLAAALSALRGVRVAAPEGGMYLFLQVPGADDSLTFAKRLVTDRGLGLAPGVAFGPEGEGWLRWCFASRNPQRLDEGVARLAQALQL
jgi:aspartate/methionine/tyrosine aminotransferase